LMSANLSANYLRAIWWGQLHTAAQSERSFHWMDSGIPLVSFSDVWLRANVEEERWVMMEETEITEREKFWTEISRKPCCPKSRVAKFDGHDIASAWKMDLALGNGCFTGWNNFWRPISRTHWRELEMGLRNDESMEFSTIAREDESWFSCHYESTNSDAKSPADIPPKTKTILVRWKGMEIMIFIGTKLLVLQVLPRG
jgi:hypothetical protein